MSDAQRSYEHGKKFPYDGSGTGRSRKPKDWAVSAARGVLADLADRRDIKRGFENVDHDVRKEIVDALAAIIRHAAKSEDAR